MPARRFGIPRGTTPMISRKCAEGGIAWYQMQHAGVSTSDQDPGGQLEALRAAARSCPPHGEERGPGTSPGPRLAPRLGPYDPAVAEAGRDGYHTL
jgi:hypothetical protein